MLMQDRTPLALTVLVKCLAHWLATGLPLVIASPLLGLFMNMEPGGDRRDDADAAGRHAGDHLHRRGGGGASPWRCRAAACWSRSWSCRLPFPVLIFGVSAAYAAVEDPAPFLPPFLFLCALTLFFAVIGPLAAGAALQGRVRLTLVDCAGWPDTLWICA